MELQVPFSHYLLVFWFLFIKREIYTNKSEKELVGSLADKMK